MSKTKAIGALLDFFNAFCRLYKYIRDIQHFSSTPRRDVRIVCHRLRQVNGKARGWSALTDYARALTDGVMVFVHVLVQDGTFSTVRLECFKENGQKQIADSCYSPSLLYRWS
jgi:hypothetical protein